MINFDSLPQENPFSLPQADIYMAKIIEAAMKQKKDGSGEYLNIKLQLTDAAGKSQGSIFDILSESDSSVIQYKLGRFIRACGLPLTGSMELKDLAKLIINRDIAVDIKIDQDKTGKYGDKAVVDLFTREAYYLPTEFAEIYALVHQGDDADKGAMNAPTETNEEVPFNAPDGGAASTPNTSANY
jgi:hypothetical protein